MFPSDEALLFCHWVSNWTHPQQHPGVEPALHQERLVELDKQEGVDSQPDQLQQQKVQLSLSLENKKNTLIWFQHVQDPKYTIFITLLKKFSWT